MAGGQTTDKELQLLQTVDLLPHLSLAEVYKLLPHNAAKWRARARKLEKKGLLTTLKRGQVGGFLGKPTDAGYARLDVAAMANRQQLDADSFVLVRLLYGEELEQARNGAARCLNRHTRNSETRRELRRIGNGAEGTNSG